MTDDSGPGRSHPSTADKPFQLNFLWRAYDVFATGVDHTLGWDDLPKLLGLFDLVGIRNVLREHNLHDTSRQPSVGGVEAPEWDPKFETERTVDGSWNDLANPTMGMAGTRFGRNVPIAHTWPDEDRLLEPNPRTVSRRLMTRDELLPASAGNALIAAWLQFMIRDWFKHGTSPTENPWTLELDPDDDWPSPPLLVHRTPPDPTTPPDSDLPPTYVNVNTHWWDGSQIYGNSADEQAFLRAHEGGRLRLVDGLPPIPDDPAHNPTLVPGFWLGLGMMQTLFVQEHNSVCAMLAKAYPGWDDERLFQRARVITSALLAKIHTIEWTPGGHRAPDGGRGPARQLVRPGRPEARPPPRPRRPGRDPHRHPRDGDRPLRRPVRADRGVRRGLPDAPAAPRRFDFRAPPTTAPRSGRASSTSSPAPPP